MFCIQLSPNLFVAPILSIWQFTRKLVSSTGRRQEARGRKSGDINQISWRGGSHFRARVEPIFHVKYLKIPLSLSLGQRNIKGKGNMLRMVIDSAIKWRPWLAWPVLVHGKAKFFTQLPGCCFQVALGLKSYRGKIIKLIMSFRLKSCFWILIGKNS